MIIASIQAIGREIVLEYDREASWSSFGFVREGEWDTHIFLGKFAIIRTNYWQQEFQFVKTVVAASLGLTGALHGMQWANTQAISGALIALA